MNLYLVETKSKFLLDEFLKTIILNDNILHIDAMNTELEFILAEASQVSMFEEMKYLIVHNTPYFSGKLSDTDESLLEHYLDHPYPLATVIFVSYEKLDMRKKITKKVKDTAKLIVLESPKGMDLEQKIKETVKKDQFDIDSKTIKYLMSACQNNYDLIFQEIEKNKIYFDDTQKFNYAEVKEITVPILSDDSFQLLDYVFQKKEEEAFQCYQDLLKQKVDAFSLINLFLREFRLMLYYSIMENNYTMSDIKKELRLQDWQINKLKERKKNYHIDDIKNFLSQIADLDFQMKSGRVDPDLGFRLFLLNVME